MTNNDPAEVSATSLASGTAATPATDTAVRPTLDKHYGRQAGFLTKLSTGTGAFNILGHRKVYYAVSGTLVVISILLIVFRGFHFGIDFAGGTTLQFQPNPGESISTTCLLYTSDAADEL